MSHQPGADLGGVRTLEDVRLRCHVHAETGCWHWRLHIAKGRTQCVWKTGGTQYKGTAARAAWILAGRRLEPGWVVSRNRKLCESDDCCNPQHHRAGPRPEVLPQLSPTQRMRHKLGVTRASRQRSKLSMEVAMQIRLSTDRSADVSRTRGIAPSTVTQIRRGETWKENPLA